tara:strand:+ start:360 stop:554 length:195 start_codon:yes stop_codon:yes gene_type:complete
LVENASSLIKLTLLPLNFAGPSLQKKFGEKIAGLVSEGIITPLRVYDWLNVESLPSAIDGNRVM